MLLKKKLSPKKAAFSSCFSGCFLQIAFLCFLRREECRKTLSPSFLRRLSPALASEKVGPIVLVRGVPPKPFSELSPFTFSHFLQLSPGWLFPAFSRGLWLLIAFSGFLRATFSIFFSAFLFLIFFVTCSNYLEAVSYTHLTLPTKVTV